MKFPKDEKKNTGRRVVSLDDARSGRRRFIEKMPDEMKREIQQQDRAEIAGTHQNLMPKRIVETRCGVCKHPYRDFIELMLLRNMTYKGIADRVTPPVSRQSISHHYKEHMDLQDAAMRRIIEEEAILQGKDFEEGVGDVLTKRSALEVALRKGYQDIIDGVTTVEPRDLVQIAKLLGDMDSHAADVVVDEARNQVALFLRAIQEVCDADTQTAIAAQVKKLRMREGMNRDIENDLIPPAKVTSPVGELVEEIDAEPV